MSEGGKSTGGAESENRLAIAGRIVYEYQRRRIEETYADFGQYDDLREYFFGLLYPPPDRRAKFAARNRAYRRVAAARILKYLFAPVTIRVLNQITELERITEDMNRKIARGLREAGLLTDQIDEQTYFRVCRETTSIGTHIKQFDFAFEGMYFGELVVKNIKLDLNAMLQLVPRTLIRNSDLLDLATNTYYCFKNHEHDLETFRYALFEREVAYIGRMFGVALDKKMPVPE